MESCGSEQTRRAMVPRRHRPVAAEGPDGRAWHLEARWATSEDEVRAAQRLRYGVFAEEMGAHLSPPAGTPPGLDADRFDPFCDHLLVHAVPGDRDEEGPLIGTYRVLPPGAAQRAGGTYTDTEFDLTPLAPLRSHAVELGRSCVHRAWRSGGVIMALWTALGQYMVRHRLDTMIGCATIGLDDHGLAAGALWQQLRRTHLVERQWRVAPRIALPLGSSSDDDADVDGDAHRTGGNDPLETYRPLLSAPPLVKGYLRCGARLLGPPALDVDFNAADLPMMLRVDEVAPRYRQHFFGTSA